MPDPIPGYKKKANKKPSQGIVFLNLAIMVVIEFSV